MNRIEKITTMTLRVNKSDGTLKKSKKKILKKQKPYGSFNYLAVCIIIF